jgi:hypothetical protein
MRFDALRHIPVFDQNGWRVSFHDRKPGSINDNCGECRLMKNLVALIQVEKFMAGVCEGCFPNFRDQSWPHVGPPEEETTIHYRDRDGEPHSRVADPEDMILTYQSVQREMEMDG